MNHDILEEIDFKLANHTILFSDMTILIKKKKLYDLKYFSYYESWLYKYVDSWGKCDVFCYRVLNPMIQKYPNLYEHIKKWAHSEQIYVRRAAPVSLIISSQNFSVNYDVDKILEICNLLKNDNHIHVQKGIGWLLKYAYLSYPESIKDYLIRNKQDISKITFTYALEKMPMTLKMQLKKY
ncbi:Predicted DNA alkylation repair enzyme [Alteracholeplasma palmae J233]|uniref:Predicted DNA alkylation repair enzyme n=1 Tax=Alteracholeplasma palmae (strain ATCC 49389 / J233) TaxID=1318466 RepID=U4KN94_ALTPJ|nr:DNA alkylation repair protein [Alteracholeplasma palmae]CCV63645.1 Predicted DNA alkylation repair enzyme [Alteracholeplasma palmae J233]